MPLISLNNASADTLVHEVPFVRLAPFSKVIRSDVDGNLILGDNSCINRSRVGRYSGMGCFSYIADAVVGKFCTFASRVSVGAFSHPTDWLSVHEFQYRDISQIYGETIIDGGQNLLSTDAKPTIIGSDVWVGDNATVARGVTLGHGSIVGMSAVVTRDVPPYSIVVGNPARVLRKRFSEAAIEELLVLQWWERDLQSLKGIDFANIDRAIEELKKRSA
jgi:acetyltransferase-like isoleucine patch superfamily enzyme